MEILEIKNNLVKISFLDAEHPKLGAFIVIASDEKSYVAQFINFKLEPSNNFAIAKLMFTFSQDGIVDNYDGSVPSVKSSISSLDSDELLSLLPVETPIKIGCLSQQASMLSVDMSVFERNLTVFSENNSEKTTFISNCIRQIFQMKEKSVIVDIDNSFEDYPKIEFSQDFKLPLNPEMIDFIFDYELAEVEASTKAIIQDIFYDVQQYIRTLDYEFLPIDKFVDVVAAQYKETQMPELALLKNKLLKYRDCNVFANSADEFLCLKDKLNEKNCVIVNVKDFNGALQNKIISYLHKTLNSLDKYAYFFVPLDDDNSDKKLLRTLVNHNHIFTIFFVSHSYKYAQELKEQADNILLFAPKTMQHDFAVYNTFLNKLNLNEGIMFGKLTQGIPFIIDMEDLELDLTKEDVFGDKYQFVPVTDNRKLVDSTGKEMPVVSALGEVLSQDEIDSYSDKQEMSQNLLNESGDFEIENTIPEILEDSSSDVTGTNDVIKPVENILEDDIQYGEYSEKTQADDFEELAQDDEDESGNTNSAELTEDDLDFLGENSDLINSNDEDDYAISESEIVEDDENPSEENSEELVPVYPAEEEVVDAEIDFAKGDIVNHPRYGRGIVEKIIKYGNKVLCSIDFDNNVGRRLLDPSISEFTKE